MLFDFARRLKEERERLGLTQRDIAKALGIDKSSVYGYERGDRSPPGQHLTTLAKLGADVLYIVSGTRIEDAAIESSLERILDSVIDLEGSPAWQKLDKEERKDLLRRILRSNAPLVQDSKRDSA